MIVKPVLFPGCLGRLFGIVNSHMKGLRNVIRDIKLLVLDVDGVLTDGSLFYASSGERYKRFNVRDGHGVKLAQAYDLEIAIISGRKCEIVNNRFLELGVKHIYQFCFDKAKKVRELSSELNIPLGQIGYVGDDILDVPALEIVGLPICPKDAHPSALSKAKLVTEANGGNGCVREVIDLVLKEQGKITL